MPTSNHGYNTPGRGEPDWDVPLNENSTQLDTDVEVRDLDANLSSYEPKDGAKFVATDTGDVYLGNGAAWTHFASLGEEAGTADLTIQHAVTVDSQQVLSREVHSASGQQFRVDTTNGGSLTVADGGYLKIDTDP